MNTISNDKGAEKLSATHRVNELTVLVKQEEQ